MSSDKEFPEYYPDRLKKISWSVDDGKVAGPMKYFNRYLPYETKGDSLFVKQVLIDNMVKKDVPITNAIDRLCQYIADCFTIYLRDGDTTFSASPKKDKNGEEKFELREWMSRVKACGLEKIFAKKLLHEMIKEAVEIYNNLV